MNDILISNKYKIHEVIYEGPLSKVYVAKNIFKNENVIIKFEDNTKTNLLQHEATIYLHLMRQQPQMKIPKFKTFGFIQNYNYIVIEKMEYSLKNIINENKLTINDTIMIGIQLFSLLKQFHSQKLVHRDIKPENIVFDKNNKIYLIDFGLSTTYTPCSILNDSFDSRSTEEFRNYVNSKGTKKFVGNINFSSINAHEGYIYYPKDDLISVVYMLFYLFFGKLPWTVFKILTNKCDTVKQIKKNIDFIDFYKENYNLTQNHPFYILFTKVLLLTIDSKLDYEQLISILSQYNTNKTFSWIENKL